MHIQMAKQELLDTLRVYLRRDDAGAYLYPRVRQRPLLLMGPPGIGKTAIVEQAAAEAQLPLVAYTMTHHTRQSAVGLPQIRERSFDAKPYSVTEYTMSEIIGAVYDAMERTGKRQGILFLDEINCVSETLAPTMLQFLQNKTFGNHALPEGWVIVAAGNPPEYNKSVREFDIVTLDRVRLLQVEAEVSAFLRYAADKGLHGAVLSYLGLKPERFYYVRRDGDTLSYVTARGWEDLSALLKGCEELEIPVNESVMGEFLNYPDTARDFWSYYRLYRKYGRDYGIRELLAGENRELEDERRSLARAGDFTERFTLVNLILERLRGMAREYARLDGQAVALHGCLKAFLSQQGGLEEYLAQRRTALKTKKTYRICSARELRQEDAVLDRLGQLLDIARENRLRDRSALDVFLKEAFAQGLGPRTEQMEALRLALENAISFLMDCFGDGPELTLLLTGITDSEDLMDFISRHGCEAYLALSDRLMYQHNETELRRLCRGEK